MWAAAGSVALIERHEVKGVLLSPALLGDPAILEASGKDVGRHSHGFRAQVLTSITV